MVFQSFCSLSAIHGEPGANLGMIVGRTLAEVQVAEDGDGELAFGIETYAGVVRDGVIW